ncbi:MAG: CBS domain-containing protein [Chloroflexi bacterium]|nr:CBS domain-containing protein [Chloroflexota bacterium]
MMRQSAPQPLRNRVELFLDPAGKTNKLPDTATLINVLEKFSEGHGAVVIIDSEERPVGIFTPSDMPKLPPAVRQDRTSLAKDLMTTPVHCVELSSTIEEALDLMQDKGLHTGIVVVESRRNMRYAGYLYRSSVAKMLSTLLGSKAY